MIAPVRPTWKERYPLIPIEEYMDWRRADGTHFDPGSASTSSSAARSSRLLRGRWSFAAPAADWAEWTGMAFPADGEYVFPGALATLVVEDGIGTHVEPNVWVLHRV